MEIKINIKKEYLMILVGLLGIALAVAYGGNNPRELGHSAGEIDIQVGNTTRTLQELVSDGLLSRGARWTPVAINLGQLPFSAGLATFNISSEISDSAKEILVYVWLRKGNYGSGDAGRVYTIYTQDGSTIYANKFFAYQYENRAWVFNSDNLWLPLTAEKKLYVHLNVSITGNKAGGVEILGYR